MGNKTEKPSIAIYRISGRPLCSHYQKNINAAEVLSLIS